MRRAETVFLIVVLLALPLALLADGGSTVGVCSGYCCLTHAPHSAPAHHSNIQMGEEKSGEGMSCHHGDMDRLLDCSMKSDGRGMDYTVLAPLAPAQTSSSARLTTPVISRGSPQPAIVAPESGFLANPFQPPRA
jgi:hypothetical protein